MIDKKLYFFLLIISLAIYSQASGILDSGKSTIHEITGKVRLVGNEPFSQLVITDAEGKNYIIQKENYSEFKNLIHHKVTVSAHIDTEELHSAGGKYTIVRYFLINPVLISK